MAICRVGSERPDWVDGVRDEAKLPCLECVRRHSSDSPVSCVLSSLKMSLPLVDV